MGSPPQPAALLSSSQGRRFTLSGLPCAGLSGENRARGAGGHGETVWGGESVQGGCIISQKVLLAPQVRRSVRALTPSKHGAGTGALAMPDRSSPCQMPTRSPAKPSSPLPASLRAHCPSSPFQGFVFAFFILSI